MSQRESSHQYILDVFHDPQAKTIAVAIYYCGFDIIGVVSEILLAK